MTKIIKVDRVKSLTEARELEGLEANFISVSLSKNSSFEDDRTIDIDTAISIKNCIRRSKYVGEISLSANIFETVEVIKKIGFDYLQLSDYSILQPDAIKYLRSQGIEIIYSNITASHDDDPSWILSHFLQQKELSGSYFQVDLLPEFDNSWEFLKNESPEYPEELQIEDINQIAKQSNLLIALDYSPNNVLEVINYLPNVKGISMVLGNSLVEDFHCFDYFEILDILKKLGNSV